MREMDRLISMLFPQDAGRQLVDLKFFPGEEPVTVEEFCDEVHSAFLRVSSGLSEAMFGFREDIKQVSIDQFLAGL